ncbi:PTS system, fructose-specific, IIA component [Clostridium sartagoforme AAU1]|uniref:PTS system, fructose-specific, IIA component n=1 Tax=Clostridium sartagoforme AAU1 TaxID=1202534 RepID=R9BVN5_9CLOT|nr:fructose PTS transporter subunit IIA [Clostridium sartagoforme]EOR20760.1 PTS system, fructose-specific, IIA component [Clostridium sartagoforme AAU1]
MESIIKRECIVFDIDVKEKNEAILILVKKLKEHGVITDTDKFYADVLDREVLSPTSIGNDIGLPHGKTENVLRPAVCFGRLKEKVLWNSETEEFANIIILIAVPGNDEDNTHIKIISRLARQLMHKEFIEKLLTSNEDNVFNMLKEGLGE